MKNILGAVLLLTTLFVKAQNILPITKEDILNKVSEDNTALKISKEEFNKTRADYRQTNAVFLPSITASHTGISTTNPLMAFGSKLNQGILTANDFNPTLLNNPSKTQNFATTFKIEQPLINADGFYKRKAAKIQMEAMGLKTQRTLDYLIFETNKAYMQLQLAYKGVEVFEKALEAVNENKKIADDKFAQGYLQQADVLSVELRVIEVKNQLQRAKSEVKNASNYLSFLMNNKSDEIYKPLDSLNLNTTNLEYKYSVSENRSDIKAVQLSLEAYKAMNNADKMAFLPKLNAFGSYELYDDKVFKGAANGYLIGAQLSWTVFEGSKRIGKVQKSRAEYNKSKLEYEQYVSQNKLELNKAKRMFIDVKNRLELTTLALKQSKEALRIRTNRFKEGLEKTSDLLLTETQYAQKQLEYYQTIFEHNYAQAYLQFLTKE